MWSDEEPKETRFFECALMSILVQTCSLAQLIVSNKQIQETLGILLLLPLLKAIHEYETITTSTLSESVLNFSSRLSLKEEVESISPESMLSQVLGGKSIKHQSFARLILQVCILTQKQAQPEPRLSKQVNPPPTPSLPLLKNDKFIKTLQTLLLSQIQSYVSHYRRVHNKSEGSGAHQLEESKEI